MPGWTRRESMWLLGGAAAAAWAGGRVVGAQAPPRAVIRTLTGDLEPGRVAGPILFHEHLSMRFPLDATSHFTDDVALMTEEARAARADGLAVLVDGGHPDMHRNLDALRAITKGSGLPVVASGGYYMQRSYPAELAGKSAEQIADDLVREAARDRLGAFGEIGQQGGTLTETERTVFRAVGLAQARTGLPIFTHNAYLGQRPGAAEIPRDAALRQLDLLEQSGADLDHLAIGHLCCLHDPKAEVADRHRQARRVRRLRSGRRWRSSPTPTRWWRRWRSSRPATPTSCCCRRTSPRRARSRRTAAPDWRRR